MILGTAAAEGVPALFCGCDACVFARTNGGKEIRARQSLYIAPDILIDLGPDAMYSVHRFGLDWTGLRAVLYTHSHRDHCCPDNLSFVRYPFAHGRPDTLDTYGNHFVRRLIAAIGATTPDDEFAGPFHLVKTFEPFALPNAEAVAIPSHHRGDGEESLNYIITRDGKSLLYCLDTGHYDEETWEFLKTIRLDGVIFECTNGLVSGKYHGHLGLPEVVEMKARLTDQGTLAADAPAAITHFSHNGIRPYAEMEAAAAPHGLQVAYDGMVVRL
ncbi:MAG TPA: MBL fold metallo-hydrolase [Armatimonadota bacterium]|jgi:phosphoribosyl 1,2-cyclic phosphate phosphodiesterase